jgi:Flp pilus assembly protein TadG
MRKKIRGLLDQDSGMVAVAAALGMVVLLGSAALAMDIGHMTSVQQELQRAADAGAMAGARGLWPATLPIQTYNPLPDCTTAQTRALNTAINQGNKVDGAALTSENVTVQVGRWNYGTKTFTSGCSASTNAVKVTIQKNGINHMFAQILEKSPANQTATSVAVMDFAQGVSKGSMPIAINIRYVVPGQTIFINFTADPLDNGGWFADPSDSASARTFRDYIDNSTCSPLKVGDLVSLQNGQDACVLHDLKAKLAEHGGAWDLVLPVVQTDNFTHSEPIAGFLPFRITGVEASGNPKGVTGTVLGLLESATATPGGINCGVLAPAKMVN